MHIFDEYKGLRRELYVLFIGRMMTALGQMIQPMLTLILSQKLFLSATTIALVFFIYTILGFPINIIGGKLADKFNKRNIIIICDLVSVLSFIYCFFAEINVFSMIVFGLASLFQSMEYPSYDALIADFTNSKDRTRAYSLGYLGANLGLVLAPTIGGLLFENHLNLAFLINGLAILSSTILIFFLIKDVHKEEDDENLGYEEVIDNSISGFAYIKQNKILFIYIFVVIFESACYSLFYYLMPLDLGLIHGSKGSLIYGTMNSINCIEVALLTAIITTFTKLLPETTKTIFGEFCEVIGFTLFMFSMRNIFMCYVAIIIFTLGEILCTISSSPFVTRRIPSSHRGRILSIVSVVGALGASLLQMLVGQVHDSSGMIIAWVCGIALGVVALILKVILRKKDKKVYAKLY